MLSVAPRLSAEGGEVASGEHHRVAVGEDDLVEVNVDLGAVDFARWRDDRVDGTFHISASRDSDSIADRHRKDGLQVERIARPRLGRPYGPGQRHLHLAPGGKHHRRPRSRCLRRRTTRRLKGQALFNTSTQQKDCEQHRRQKLAHFVTCRTVADCPYPCFKILYKTLQT
jgi:hypothetical protein